MAAPPIGTRLTVKKDLMKFDSLLARMDRLPPCLCRLFARKRCRGGTNAWAPKSHREIAEASGLPKSKVAELSRRKTWRGTPVDVADRFARACGVVDIDAALKRLRNRRTRLQHLGRGNRHQRRMIADLLDQAKPGKSSDLDIPC